MLTTKQTEKKFFLIGKLLDYFEKMEEIKVIDHRIRKQKKNSYEHNSSVTIRKRTADEATEILDDFNSAVELMTELTEQKKKNLFNKITNITNEILFKTRETLEDISINNHTKNIINYIENNIKESFEDPYQELIVGHTIAIYLSEQHTKGRMKKEAYKTNEDTPLREEETEFGYPYNLHAPNDNVSIQFYRRGNKISGIKVDATNEVVEWRNIDLNIPNRKLKEL